MSQFQCGRTPSRPATYCRLRWAVTPPTAEWAAGSSPASVFTRGFTPKASCVVLPRVSTDYPPSRGGRLTPVRHSRFSIATKTAGSTCMFKTRRQRLSEPGSNFHDMVPTLAGSRIIINQRAILAPPQRCLNGRYLGLAASIVSAASGTRLREWPVAAHHVSQSEPWRTRSSCPFPIPFKGQELRQPLFRACSCPGPLLSFRTRGKMRLEARVVSYSLGITLCQ